MEQLDQLKQNLKQVEDQLAAENGKGAEKNPSALAILEQRKSDLVQQIASIEQEQAAQQEKQQRDQKQQEVIDNAVDLLPTIFDALLPESTYSQLFGINSYNEKRQQFYQIVKAYTADQVQAVSNQYEQDLAAKDAKIQLLNKQSLEVQQQADAGNAQISELTKQLQDEKDAHDKTQADLAAIRSQLATVQAESATKDEKIAELQAKAVQPVAQASASTQDLITQIKNKNQVNADDMIARFNARQKSDEVKIPLPEVASAPATFPATESANDTVHNDIPPAPDATIQPPTVGDTFPAQVDTPAAGLADQEQGVQQAGDVTAEIGRIKARLDRLEKQANLPALEVA